jgi:hypothetical protein
MYAGDPSSTISFLDESPLYGAKAGGASTGTTGDENVITFPDAMFNHHVLGTQTILYPPWSTSGLDMVQDVADNDGCEISAPIEASSAREFVVGQEEISLRVELTIADITDTDDCAMGLRKKEAFQANLDDYDEMACMNVIVGAVYTETILNGAGTTSTDTTDTVTDTETHTYEVRVDMDGAVTYRLDDAEPTTVVAYSFDAGEVLIPFFYHINVGAADPGTVASKFFAIPAVLKRDIGA